MKIDLGPDKENALQRLVAVGGAGVEALRELFALAEAELRDVMNINPQGNMGLQSLASQKAVEALTEVRDHIFPELSAARRREKPVEEGQPGKYR